MVGTPLVQGKHQREQQAVGVSTVGVRRGTHVRQHTNAPLVSRLAPALHQEGEQRHQQQHAGNAADHNAGNGTTTQAAALVCVNDTLSVSGTDHLPRRVAGRCRLMPLPASTAQAFIYRFLGVPSEELAN